MSLQEVERAADERARADTRLREACVQAARAGIPHAPIARAARVARNTVRAWVAEAEDRGQ